MAQALGAQSTGHLCVLQILKSVVAPHFLPPYAADTVVTRERVV
jgi:hypothetical protein